MDVGMCRRCGARSTGCSRFLFLLTLALALPFWWLIFQILLAQIDTIHRITHCRFTASGQRETPSVSTGSGMTYPGFRQKSLAFCCS